MEQNGTLQAVAGFICVSLPPLYKWVICLGLRRLLRLSSNVPLKAEKPPGTQFPCVRQESPNRQLPVGTGFGSVRWHQSQSELSAGGRVALEMLPGFTRAKKMKKKKNLM